MTEQNIDHAQVMVPPPLVFLGYFNRRIDIELDCALSCSMDIYVAHRWRIDGDRGILVGRFGHFADEKGDARHPIRVRRSPHS